MNGLNKKKEYNIHSIEKALDVIEILNEHEFLNLIQMSELLEQPKSSLYRIIMTLENRGYIAKSVDNGKYCLSYKIISIGKNILHSNPLRNAAISEMNELSEKYGDTVNLGVYADGVITYLDIVEGTYSLRMSETAGSQVPVHSTGIGKAIAAFLPMDQVDKMLERDGMKQVTPNTITDADQLRQELEKVKRQGYAVDDQENVEGAICVASPIFNMLGKVSGAISLSGAAHRYSADKIPQIAHDVRNAALQISYKLGYTTGK